MLKENQMGVYTRLPKELGLRLKLEALRSGIRIQSIITRALDSYLPAQIRISAGQKRAKRAASVR